MTRCKRAIAVGHLPDSHERAFVGTLAGVRLWNRALTADEAAAVHRGTDPAGLVAAWEPGRKEEVANAVKGGPRLVRVSTQAKALNVKADGFKGIWYMNQPSHDEYVYRMPRWFDGDFATPEPYAPGMADLVRGRLSPLRRRDPAVPAA